MSRLSSRLSSITAGCAIVLLVVFLVIMWSGVKTSIMEVKNNDINSSTTAKQSRVFRKNEQLDVFPMVSSGLVTFSPVQENDGEFINHSHVLKTKEKNPSNF